MSTHMFTGGAAAPERDGKEILGGGAVAGGDGQSRGGGIPPGAGGLPPGEDKIAGEAAPGSDGGGLLGSPSEKRSGPTGCWGATPVTTQQTGTKEGQSVSQVCGEPLSRSLSVSAVRYS